jgi:hypothetical protein
MGRSLPIILISFLLILDGYSALETVEITQGLTILNAERELDISSQLIKENVNFELENNDKSPLKYFVFGVAKEHDKFLAWIEASVSFSKLFNFPHFSLSDWNWRQEKGVQIRESRRQEQVRLK